MQDPLSDATAETETWETPASVLEKQLESDGPYLPRCVLRHAHPHPTAPKDPISTGFGEGSATRKRNSCVRSPDVHDQNDILAALGFL